MSLQNDIAEVLVSEEAIGAKVSELGQRISEDYQGQELLLVGLLRGAIVFLSDLMRALDIPVQLDFIGISSYGVSTDSGRADWLMRTSLFEPSFLRDVACSNMYRSESDS